MDKKLNNEAEAIKYIHQLPRLHRKNDLSYVKRVLAYFGNPQDQIKTVHITGTNGKGSTSYYLNNLLQKSGFKTGLFVSPFITEFNERIQLNSQNIPSAELVKLTNLVQNAVAAVSQEDSFELTEFEFIVVLAFIYFAKERVDIAIIEAGIGAKHDKTNVLTPVVSLITSVGLDHEQLIGPTILDIAAEKSGIIKQNVPVVVGELSPDVLKLIKATAKRNAAPLSVYGQDFTTSENAHDHTFSYSNQATASTLHFLPRPDVEQIDVALAVTAFGIIGAQLMTSEIEESINQTLVPGRYQTVLNEPLVIVDGAHNVQAMTNFYRYLLGLVKGDATKIHFLVTMMRDKDVREVLDVIAAADVTLTTIASPRAAQKTDYAELAIDKLPFESDFRLAYEKLRQKSHADDIIAVTGSFYFVTDFLREIKEARKSSR